MQRVVKKNRLYKVNFVIGLLAFGFSMCHKEGTCDKSEKIKFRNINISFPISGYEVMRMPQSRKLFTGDWIRIDSIIPGVTAYWFNEQYQNAFNNSDTTRYLKDARMHGVSFYLWEESQKSDKDLLAELNKIYPGNYQYFEKGYHKYHLNHQQCMSVIFRRVYFDSTAIPVISFCYGLTEQEEHFYGQTIGKTTNWD